MSMKRSRKLLSIVVVFFWASEYAHVPYFAPYLEMLGFGASAIGVMTGVYGMTQLFVRIPLGITTDVTGGYKKVVVMGTVFTTLSSFLLIFASSPWLIIFCRFLAGVAASTWLAFSVLYSAYYDPEEGVSAMTSINVYNNVGKLVAFAFGTLVATLWGIRFPLVVSFLAGIVAVVFALMLKEVPIKKEPMKVGTLLRTFRNPGVLIAAGFAIILQMVSQGTAFSFTSTVAQMLGASALEIGINTSLFTVVQVVAGTWIGMHYVKKVGDTKAVMTGFFCMSLSCVLVAVAANVWFLYLAQIVGGIGNIILMSLLMAMAIRQVPIENKSTAMGLFQALYSIGMTAGPVLLGTIVERANYKVGYMAYGVACLVAVVLASVLIPKLE